MNTNPARKWESTSSQYESQQKSQVKVKIHKTGWVTKGEKFLYMIIGVCLILAGTYIVSYSSSTDHLNRELQTLEQNVQSQVKENENLQFEVDRLSDPARITKIARENGLKIQYAEVKRASQFKNN